MTVSETTRKVQADAHRKDGQAFTHTTPRARLRHDDSQIEFAAIESSPSRDQAPQVLTAHQEEVAARQKAEAVALFPDIRSDPLSQRAEQCPIERSRQLKSGYTTSPSSESSDNRSSRAGLVFSEFKRAHKQSANVDEVIEYEVGPSTPPLAAHSSDDEYMGSSPTPTAPSPVVIDPPSSPPLFEDTLDVNQVADAAHEDQESARSSEVPPTSHELEVSSELEEIEIPPKDNEPAAISFDHAEDPPPKASSLDTDTLLAAQLNQEVEAAPHLTAGFDVTPDLHREVVDAGSAESVAAAQASVSNEIELSSEEVFVDADSGLMLSDIAEPTGVINNPALHETHREKHQEKKAVVSDAESSLSHPIAKDDPLASTSFVADSVVFSEEPQKMARTSTQGEGPRRLYQDAMTNSAEPPSTPSTSGRSTRSAAKRKAAEESSAREIKKVKRESPLKRILSSLLPKFSQPEVEVTDRNNERISERHEASSDSDDDGMQDCIVVEPRPPVKQPLVSQEPLAPVGSTVSGKAATSTRGKRRRLVTAATSESEDQSSQPRKRRSSLSPIYGSQASRSASASRSEDAEEIPQPKRVKKGSRATTRSSAAVPASADGPVVAGTRRLSHVAIFSTPASKEQQRFDGREDFIGTLPISSHAQSRGDLEALADTSVQLSTAGATVLQAGSVGENTTALTSLRHATSSDEHIDATGTSSDRPKLKPKSILARLKQVLEDCKQMVLGSSQEEREFDDVLFEVRKEVHEAARRSHE